VDPLEAMLPAAAPADQTHPSTPVRKLDAEHVEAMWSLPTCGVLQAGLIAAGIIVRVGAPAGRAYPRAVALPADRRGPRHAFAPPRVARAAQPEAHRRSIPAKD